MRIRHAASRQHEFAAGHRILGHGGKCARQHGHGYVVHFFCESDGLDSLGRVIDFSVMKTLLCNWIEKEWDHKNLLYMLDPLAEAIAAVDFESVVKLPVNPSAENLAEYLLTVVGPQQLKGTGVRLVKVVLEETRKCHATAQFANDGTDLVNVLLSEEQEERLGIQYEAPR